MELITKFTETKKMAAERLAICETCVYYRPKTTQCAKCGCIMTVKTLWPAATCPKGKWPVYEEKEDNILS